jgi:hypothetical protein
MSLSNQKSEDIPTPSRYKKTPFEYYRHRFEWFVANGMEVDEAIKWARISYEDWGC